MTTATAEQVSERATDEVALRLERAMSDYMTEAQAEMRTMISVPVQYYKTGQAPPRSMRHPIKSLPGPGLLTKKEDRQNVIRSKTGEAPRKEFGNYYDSMKVIVSKVGDIIRGILGTDIKDGRAPVLEWTLNRPHFRTMYERMRSSAARKIKEYMR